MLGVILALLDDLDEPVQLTAVSCLLTVNSFSVCVCARALSEENPAITALTFSYTVIVIHLFGLSFDIS